MQPNWAEENLQVIRTLMERSGLYRRALAPVMLSTGLLGAVAAVVASRLVPKSFDGFIYYWSLVALLAVGVCAFISRRQALHGNEAFWSAPTKRIIFALVPGLLSGAAIPLMVSLVIPKTSADNEEARFFIPLWLMFYGTALHSAALFISAGMRWLAWGFIVAGVLTFCLALTVGDSFKDWVTPHALMGVTFGGFHIVAGVYLYFTEQRDPKP